MKVLRVFSVIAVWLMLVNSDVLAQKTAKYVGVSKCRACHLLQARGAQFKVWQDSPHAKAFEVLGTPEAKEVAAKAGVEDPQKAGACLQCHQTAYGVDPELVDRGFKTGNGVECESCHGPGSLYRVASVMNARKYEADPEETLRQWKELGLVVPDEKVCVQCHNKGFDFKEYFAKIAHPNPKIKKK